MNSAERLSEEIDKQNYNFTSGVKERILPKLSSLHEDALEWLIMEHYQFSFANKGLLQAAVQCTARLAEPGVTRELQRNVDEEDGHAPMYKRGMLEVGTDMDRRVEFAPTTQFLQQVRELCSPDPSRALGALYATETAAIFEHETLFEICREISERRNFKYEGSLIKHFHDLHLGGGVEQGHKDGLAIFVDSKVEESAKAAGEPIDKAAVKQAALQAINVMQTWWDKLITQAFALSASAQSR
jgi:hypothetical protein